MPAIVWIILAAGGAVWVAGRGLDDAGDGLLKIGIGAAIGAGAVIAFRRLR